jgi:hypothetical protein
VVLAEVRVTDRDGDDWLVRLRWVDAPFRFPAFKRRARHLDSLPAPQGIGEAHYRWSYLPSVLYWFVVLVYPLIAVVALLSWLMRTVVSVVARLLGRAPWQVKAWRPDRPKKSLTYEVGGSLMTALRTTRAIAHAIATDEDKYEVEGAELVSDPLFTDQPGGKD